MRRFTDSTPPIIPRLRALSALPLLIAAIGCAELEGGAPIASGPERVEGTMLALVIHELDVLDDCDPSNGSPGDFYVSAGLVEESGGQDRSVGLIDSHLVSSYIAHNALDLELAHVVPNEAGRQMRLVVGYNEHDGGSSYDGQAARAHRYTYQPAEDCWLDFTETECLAPGDRSTFEMALSEDPRARCRATLAYDIEVVPTTQSASEYAAGAWSGEGLMLSLARHRPEDRGEGVAFAWECRGSGPIDLTIEPAREHEVVGGGACRAGTARSGQIDFLLEADFVDARRLEGTITFDVDGQRLGYPVEGERTLDTIQWRFAGTVADPSDGAWSYDAAGGFGVVRE